MFWTGNNSRFRIGAELRGWFCPTPRQYFFSHSGFSPRNPLPLKSIYMFSTPTGGHSGYLGVLCRSVYCCWSGLQRRRCTSGVLYLVSAVLTIITITVTSNITIILSLRVIDIIWKSFHQPGWWFPAVLLRQVRWALPESPTWVLVVTTLPHLSIRMVIALSSKIQLVPIVFNIKRKFRNTWLYINS